MEKVARAPYRHRSAWREDTVTPPDQISADEGEEAARESDWRPRANDHLVEPIFGGLSVESAESSEASDTPTRRERWWERLLARLRGSSDPAS
jgi:hypothetical protein